MTIPELFIMCDKSIRKIYGCEDNGAGYINFMIRMSHFARSLVIQAEGDKQNLLSLIHLKDRTLARLLDIYNYVKTHS